jgi:hypothetical protein
MSVGELDRSFRITWGVSGMGENVIFHRIGFQKEMFDLMGGGLKILAFSLYHRIVDVFI